MPHALPPPFFSRRRRNCSELPQPQFSLSAKQVSPHPLSLAATKFPMDNHMSVCARIYARKPNKTKNKRDKPEKGLWKCCGASLFCYSPFLQLCLQGHPQQQQSEATRTLLVTCCRLRSLACQTPPCSRPFARIMPTAPLNLQIASASPSNHAQPLKPNLILGAPPLVQAVLAFPPPL